jgi:very-short-patch-repair endonuclease
VGGPPKETSIEKKVREELVRRGVIFEQEVLRWYRRCHYKLDFYIPSLKLSIECDGDFWHNSPRARWCDARKDKRMLSKFGIRIVRITESEINQDVVKAINKVLGER